MIDETDRQTETDANASPTRIVRLDDATVERIAAGEVVRRPASVVKELVENSLDAGASRVSIAVENGGVDLVRVADDGCGMDEADALLAFERHTTSKIRRSEDVDRIATLGFRGEALSSIARMARVTLTTKRDGIRGTRVAVDERDPAASVAGRGVGTTVTVRDLFYNAPARRKSLASTKREFGAVSHIVTRYALCRPDVRFRLSHDGRQVFTTPGSGSYTDAVLGTYDRTVAGQSTEFASDGSGDTPWDRAPDAERPPRGDDARQSNAGVGASPTDMSDPTINAIDVEGLVASPAVTRAAPEHVFTAVNGRTLREETIRDAVLAGYGTLLPSDRYPIAVVCVSLPPEAVDVNVHPTKANVAFHDPEAVETAVETAVREALAGTDLSRTADLGFDLESSLASLEGESTFEDVSVIGQFRRSYLLCEADEDLLVIDQHAAHERINYERLRARLGTIESAAIDPPATVALSPAEAAVVEAERETLRALGFDLESAGGDLYRVGAIPAPIGQVSGPAAIRDVLDAFLAGGDPADPREELLKSLACHPSIRGGDALADETASRLVERLGTCEQPFACPHGRPTVLSIDERAFINGFERGQRRLG